MRGVYVPTAIRRCARRNVTIMCVQVILDDHVRLTEIRKGNDQICSGCTLPHCQSPRDLNTEETMTEN
jgi:hypothetical protein